MLPSVVMITVGLLYPGLRTIYESFRDASSTKFVGFDNYVTIFTDSDQLTVLRNTAIWVIRDPDRRHPDRPGLRDPDRQVEVREVRQGADLPADGDLAGRRLAHLEVRLRLQGRPRTSRSASLNAILKLVGLDTYRFLLTEPWNTIFLIVIMIWVQAGFAMMVLSASIKAIPDDIVEAARLDGVSGFRMFRYITVPSIRPSLIVVLTTISIATLKVFDIVRTTTGGNFDTSVLAYEFYVQSFRSFNAGLGAALAVLLFVLVIPIVVYNVRQMRQLEAR